jgi:hypothetical protein
MEMDFGHDGSLKDRKGWEAAKPLPICSVAFGWKRKSGGDRAWFTGRVPNKLALMEGVF